MDEHPLKSDEELVAEVLSGQRGAFETLIGQYQGLVAHLVFRLIGNRDDREEVCQDVFIKVHKQLQTFRFQSKLSTWISRIAYTTAVNQLRKSKLTTVEYNLEEISQDHGPAEEMNDQNMKAHVHDHINLLSTVEKSVITFYHLEEMSVGEISQVMMRPEGTIKSDLFRARQKLRKMMTAEDYR